MTRARVVIASAADEKYALPLAVMLQSAAENLAPSSRLDAYVVDDGILSADREKISVALPAQISLYWVLRSSEEFEGLPNWGRMSLTTYHKLTLSEWLPPEVERVIWLDADTLVLGDLTQLWDLNSADQIALAARDAGVRFVSSRFGVSAYRELGISPTGKYFNAGVMLIYLARWRIEKIGERAFDYLRRYHDRVFFWDQEALNGVLAGKWGMLDPRWNWNLVADRLQQRAADPAIIHFSGNLKPWKYRGTNPEHALYYYSLDQTAWPGWRPPLSWRGRFISWYEHSRLRAFLYPLERLHLRLVRWRARR